MGDRNDGRVTPAGSTYPNPPGPKVVSAVSRGPGLLNDTYRHSGICPGKGRDPESKGERSSRDSPGKDVGKDVATLADRWGSVRWDDRQFSRVCTGYNLLIKNETLFLQ